jgi:tRNA pseudouridine38-40 synthase
MRNIKLLIQYDGTCYHGWQSQKQGESTIQSVLEECVIRLTGKGGLKGAGRTDSGVHALGQVALFRTSSELPIPTIKRALNAMLPGDIRIISVEQADEPFHPRFSAVSKSYLYLIANTDIVSPFLGRYAWQVPQKLNIKAMKMAADGLVGRHDFRAFMGSGSSVKDTIREVTSLTVKSSNSINFLGFRLSGRFVKIGVEGDGFLRHMVRNIVGTLVEIGKGKIETGSIHDILASGDRRLAGPTTPARGLFLLKVDYGS